MSVFTHRSRLPHPADVVFAWHARPGALDRLLPPWERIRVEQAPESIRDGARGVIVQKIGPVSVRWSVEHHGYEEGRVFRDRQVSGPFALWEHEHRIEPDGPDACTLVDSIRYALPAGAVGRLLGGRHVRKQLERTFAYRHRVTTGDLARHAATGSDARPLRVLVSGASGLLGGALAPFLTTGGHEVVALSRSGGDGAIRWDPARGELDAARLEGFDAVVHLAGENIAGRWTTAKKERIRASRVDGTRLLTTALAECARPPRVLVCASAVGFYGDRGDERLDESSSPGSGFLPDVCRAWEAAADPARAAGIRVAHVRLGMVLTPAGGALEQMLTPFRFGLGGPVGSGEQFWSWIARDDAVDVIHRALTDDGVEGAVNAVAPDPPTSRGFARALGRVLRRPAIAPLPAFVVRGVLGEMGVALLLASTRVDPARLDGAGFEFRHPDLDGALRHLLGAV